LTAVVDAGASGDRVARYRDDCGPAATLEPTEPHSVAVAVVPEGSRVLDIGCGPGRLARLLHERGCTVVGIDRDPDAVDAASEWCERVVVADLESDLDGLDVIDRGRPFDAVCLLDVLEHVRNPLQVLQWASKVVSPDSLVLICIPNVTHAAMKLQLLRGRFEYTPLGLLDETHIRFYDRAAVERLMADAGLEVLERLRTRRGVTETEIATDDLAWSPEVLAEATRDEDALTYQFFYVTTVGGSARPSVLARYLKSRLEQTRQELLDTSATSRELGAALQSSQAEAEASQAEAAEAHQNLEDARRCGSELEGALDMERARAHELEAALNDRTVIDSLERDCQALRERASELEGIVAATRARAAYRLVDRVQAAFGSVPGLQRAGRAVVRRVVRGDVTK
jgi:methionine biosynthesis protein MetW